LLSNVEHMDQIDQQMNQHKKELDKIAAELTKKRKGVASKLEKNIQSELKELMMKNSVFEVNFSETSLREFGKDDVQFMISTNQGELPKPLEKIISGGEASRIMLALKKIIAEVDQVGTLVFDEIDANIGGRLGKVIGEKLREIAKNSQILIVTHLPQIASLASTHFKVSKHVHGSRTTTNCRKLKEPEKVTELAEMMSGNQTTQISRKHAKELLEEAKH